MDIYESIDMGEKAISILGRLLATIQYVPSQHIIGNGNGTMTGEQLTYLFDEFIAMLISYDNADCETAGNILLQLNNAGELSNLDKIILVGMYSPITNSDMFHCKPITYDNPTDIDDADYRQLQIRERKRLKRKQQRDRKKASKRNKTIVC